MSIFVFTVANRLKKTRQQDGYISFVSSASTIGIGLGCAVLLLLLSVMNGFEYELRHSLLRVVPHAELFAADDNGLYPEPNFIKKLKNDARVRQVFLLNKQNGLLQAGKNMKAVSVVGAEQEYFESKLSKSSSNEISALYQKLNAQENGVLLGKKILKEQGITIGDKVQLLVPASTKDLSFKAPKSAWLVVVGELSVGGDLDNQLAIVQHTFLQSLMGFTENVSHIEVQLNDPFEAFQLVRDYGYDFPQAAYMSDWTRTKGHLYQDIKLIRVMVYIVLVLVIAVACFNIVSALIMSVKEKSKEIAILKTIGASGPQIAFIFVLKGLYHGLKGAFYGSIIGVLISIYLGDILLWLEKLLGVSILSLDIYFTNSIPSKFLWSDLWSTLIVVVAIAALATLYPALKAAGVIPADNLH